ncbi:uncharacterized protein LOC131843464 isoform X2 [Achroia grisella]|nr:uncharacterized protein LOC131843464 isoform X2 [Achroia grisella]
MGKFDTKNPAGILILENSSIQKDSDQSIPFSFSISFQDEPEKRHIFAARAEENVAQWVSKIEKCTYEYLRKRLYELQSRIYSITSKDPLLLVPRNEGACLWAPSIPFSTTPACTVNTTSFSCHLHASGGFSLERSKSDVQTHKKFNVEFSKKATFYTGEHNQNTESKEHSINNNFALQRSKTSALSTGNINPTIFDNRPALSRAAPSPPARVKLLTASTRAETNDISKTFTEHGKLLATTGILDKTPIPPKRKVSPKYLDVRDGKKEECSDKPLDMMSDDLIQF